MKKIVFMHRVLLVLFISVILQCPMKSMAQKGKTNTLPSLKGKKVLIVYGGWKGHRPGDFVARIKPWLISQGAEVSVSDSLGVYTNAKLMAETDLFIQSWTMGQITKAQIEGLTQAVMNGAGIAGCHGGLGDSFRNNAKYQYMIGGQWVSHPGGQIEYTVNISNRKDPISKKMDDFKIKTEQYYMHVDPNVKVLATTTFTAEYDRWIEDAVMPVAWKKNYGKGRVFYFSVGHNPEDFDVAQAWTLLTRGMRWASGSKYEPEEIIMDPVYK